MYPPKKNKKQSKKIFSGLSCVSIVARRRLAIWLAVEFISVRLTAGELYIIYFYNFIPLGFISDFLIPACSWLHIH